MIFLAKAHNGIDGKHPAGQQARAETSLKSFCCKRRIKEGYLLRLAQEARQLGDHRDELTKRADLIKEMAIAHQCSTIGGFTCHRWRDARQSAGLRFTVRHRAICLSKSVQVAFNPPGCPSNFTAVFGVRLAWNKSQCP